MKIQDIVFMAIAFGLFVFRKPNFFVLTGLVFIILSIPLFYFHIFFTAERLTWYAAFMFAVATLHLLFKSNN